MIEKALLRPLEQVEIQPDRAGQRLDNFLFARLKNVPKTVVYRILRTGQVRVNKGRAKPHYKLQAGDLIRIPPLRAAESELEVAAKPLAERAGAAVNTIGRQLREAVLFEDDGLLILDKPAGLAVHGGSGLQFGLIEILTSFDACYEGVELVHRLDRGTSGCLILAKNHAVLRRLHTLLREHAIEKTYVALLKGIIRKPVTVDAALARNTRGGERMVNVAEHGKSALTHIVPQRWYRNTTLAEIRIETGRTHQIRVHCAELGHALAGDDKYGDRAFNKMLRKFGLKRLFLHALSVRFKLDRNYVATAPLPDELTAVLEKME